MVHKKFNLRVNVLSEIPVDFHNGSNYDYHFIIKKLAKEFEGQIERFGKILKSANLFSFW